MPAEPQFHQLLNILQRRRGLILAMAAFGAILAGIGGLLIPPEYTAKVQIVIEVQPAALLGGQRTAIPQAADEAVIQTHVTALTSRDHLQHVLDSLSEDPTFQAAGATRSELGAIIGNTWKRIAALLPDSWLRAAVVARPGLLRQAAIKEPVNTTAAKAGMPNLEWLERRLRVYQERGSHVIAVGFTSRTPESAAAVANRVAQLYIESQSERLRDYTNRSLAWLNARNPEIKNEADRAEAAVQEYRTTHGLAGANRTDVIDQNLADLNRQLSAAEADLASRQARLSYVRDLRRLGVGSALVENLNSPALAELHRQELVLLQSEAELATTFGESHPKMQLLRSQLQELRHKIDQEIDRVVNGLENEAQIVGARVRLIRQRLGAMEDASSKARESEVRLHDLEREAAARRQIYNDLLQRQREIREQQEIIAPDARILSLASPPDRPSSPNPFLFILPALIVSSIGGSLLAVVMDRLDRGLRSERDVSETLGIRCIGFVPQLSRIRRMHPHEVLLAKPFAAYTEAIRSIVASSHLIAPQCPPQAILVSSSVPGEGKTTLAVSFAVCAALLGRRVLLVDLDFRCPAIGRELDATAEKGILDLLVHGGPSADVIQHIPRLQLEYLPVCGLPADPLALFASEQLPRLLDRLRESYDCVVIDSPPLLAVPEARLLASMVDKVLFVVKWGSTRREVAQNALNLLRTPALSDKARSEFASAVVTQVDLKKHARYRYGDLAESFVKYRKYYVEKIRGADLALPTAQAELPEMRDADGRKNA